MAAIPELKWFSVVENLDHVISDYSRQEFSCVSMGTWITCDPDEALRVLVPKLNLMERDAMRHEDWAKLSTLCSGCEFSGETLDEAARLRVERDESGTVAVIYATRESMGFYPGILVHRDEVSADGSVKRWQEEFRRPAPRGSARPLSDGDIDRGMSRLRSAFDTCALKHGAIDGTRVNIDFSISARGYVEGPTCRPPFGRSPLGYCLIKTLVRKGKFPASRQGRQGVEETITLHRRDP